MNKVNVCWAAVVLFSVLPLAKAGAQDPITLIIKEGIKKAIIAADLQVQRLQNRTIWLQNAQKVLENTMSKLKLEEITGWVEKQRVLYADYFEELWQVKSFVSYYQRVRGIIALQVQLVNEYKRAWNGVQQDGHFTREEVIYIGKVYTGIVEESLKNLEQVSMVINAFTTQMSEASRLEVLNNAAIALEENYLHLKVFNTQNIFLSLQRAKDANDVSVTKALYGIE